MSSNVFPMKPDPSTRRINWVITGILILLSVIQMFPLIWLIDFSLLRNSDFFSSGLLVWPNPPRFDNYVKAWTDGNIPQHFLNSMMVTGLTILLVDGLSLTLGYAFSRMVWKGRNAVLSVILLGVMVPIHATLLPNYLVFARLGILNTRLSLILPYTAFCMPVGVFLMTGFLKAIPKSLEESAVMDGCRLYRLLYGIIVPLAKPVLVTISLMTFMSCWNEFIMAATFLSTKKYQTLPFAVYSFVGLYGSNMAVQFACMFLATLPALVVYVLLNEQMTKGVTAGAVKG